MKTSEYIFKSFPTISFKPSSFMGSFIGSCTFMVNIFSSFCTHFLNCLVESKWVLSKVHIFVSSKAEPLGFVRQSNPPLHVTNASMGSNHYMLKMTS
jgi:hypothetical protein